MRRLFQELEYARILVNRRLFGFERGVCGGLSAISTPLVPRLLARYGAKLARGVRVLPPLVIHNAGRSFENLSIGEDAYVGRDCLFDLKNRIEIGARATLAMRVSIVTHLDVGHSSWAARGYPPANAPVVIGEDAYVGAGAILLPGVRIGAGAMVGAAALVRHDVPPGARVAGVPARDLDAVPTLR